MKLDKEQTRQLNDAIVTMSQNLFIDEPFSAFVAATSYCETCDDFHLHAFDGEEMLVIAGMKGMFYGMMTGDTSQVIISACKKIGASFANSDKTVLAATLVGFAENYSDDSAEFAALSKEEKVEHVNEKMARGELESKKMLLTGTFSAPNNYFSVSFDIEQVHENDLVLINREERDERGDKGNFYDAQEQLVLSANFLSDVRSRLEACKTGEDVIDGDNLEKFRSFLYRLETVTSLEELDK
jgi:hypothetical protein